jgi:ATP-dependent protease HslVU (ClpYQ) peptidase subunit
MAGDGWGHMHGTIVEHAAVKVVKLNDGSLFGSCGGAVDRDRMVEWLNAGQPGDWPKRTEFGGILVRPNGDVFTCGDSDGFARVVAPCAVGSGMDVAIGAMDAGCDPAEAVRIAAGRDPHTGGTITVEAL